jgi:hypothetical protein
MDTPLKYQVKVYSSFYNDLTHLRAAISAIPLIGSQLDLYLSTPGQKFVEERLEYLINQIKEEVETLKADSVSYDLMNSEIGFDLINKTFAAAARTRQKDKLDLFAKIIKGSFKKQSQKHDPELYLRIIDELNEQEIQIALMLYDIKVIKGIKIEGENDAQDGMTTDAEWFSRHVQIFSKEEIEFAIPRLVRSGLFKEIVGSFIGYGGGQYTPTTIFIDFIKFIEKYTV